VIDTEYAGHGSSGKSPPDTMIIQRDRDRLMMVLDPTTLLSRVHDGKRVVNLAAISITCLHEQVSQNSYKKLSAERRDGSATLPTWAKQDCSAIE